MAIDTDIDGSTETENLRENTPRRKTDQEIETSTSVSITSQEVNRQITAVTDPPSQQLAHLYELCGNLRTSHRADVTKRPPRLELLAHYQVSGSGSWSDNVYKTKHLLRRSPFHLLVSFHTLR